MAPRKSTKKASTAKVEEAASETDEAAKSDAAVGVTGRPNDTPIVDQEPHFTSSTFADRAKASGRNKRVADADSKG